MSELSDLLDELDFESWLEHEGIRFKLTRGKSGIQANIRECPSCGNTKWKVYFGTESGRGNCFVCDTSFNKWQFIAAHLGTSNSDVFQYIKAYAGTQGWRPKVVAPAATKPNELVLPDSMPIPIKGQNLSYLADRGVTLELAQYFGLRYCHSGSFLYRNAYGKPEAQDYSRRVIIPVYDLDGTLRSFQGRDITGLSEKRYLFPPEFASTGSILYNGQNAKGSGRVVIGEGVFDCIATKAAMDEDKVLRTFTAIASFGKKLGDEQVAKLMQLKEGGLKEVVFLWDAEKEALNAAVEAALNVRSHGLGARIGLLPKGKDPNEVPGQVVRDAIWKSIQVDAQVAIKLKLAARSL